MPSAVDNEMHSSEVQLHLNFVMSLLWFMKLQISKKKYRTISEV